MLIKWVKAKRHVRPNILVKVSTISVKYVLIKIVHISMFVSWGRKVQGKLMLG